MGGGCVGLNFFGGLGGFLCGMIFRLFVGGGYVNCFSGCLFVGEYVVWGFQAAFVNSVRSEAAHPMVVGISVLGVFRLPVGMSALIVFRLPMRVVLAASRRSILLPFYFGFQAASNSFSGCLINSVRSESAHPTAKPVFRLPIRFSSDIYWTASVRGDTTLGRRVCWGLGYWRSSAR